MTILMRQAAKDTRPSTTALSVRHEEPQPEILVKLRTLDALLRTAVARARVLFGSSDDDGAFHGLYVSEDEIDSLMERASGETLGSDESITEARLACLASSWMPAVSDHWGLTDFDNAALLLALAPELDLRYERIYAYLQDDVTKRRCTVDLALNLLCDGSEERLERRTRFAPEAPLVRSGILKLLADPSAIEPPLLAHYLRLDERALRALLGDNSLDSRLASFCEYCTSSTQPLASSRQSDVARRLPAFAAGAQKAGRQARLLFSGPAASSKQQVATTFAHDSGKALLAADLERSSSWKKEPAAIASLLAREAALTNSLIYVSGLRPDPSEQEAADRPSRRHHRRQRERVPRRNHRRRSFPRHSLRAAGLRHASGAMAIAGRRCRDSPGPKCATNARGQLRPGAERDRLRGEHCAAAT
jgi:winged helix domain-containing protein